MVGGGLLRLELARVLLGVLLIPGMAGLAGCSVDVAAGLAIPEGVFEQAEDLVVVRFKNLTIGDAVDVEFYSTDEPIEELPGDLFDSAHLLTEDLGFAGTGLLPPMESDTLILPCTDAMFVGTMGGSFVDVETGDVRGRGIPLWMQAEPLGLCGSVITFEFAVVGEEFSTFVRVGR